MGDRVEQIEKKPNRLVILFKKYLQEFLDIWKDKKKTFYLLFSLLALILIILMAYPNYYGTYLNCNTDDILQYYPYISGFFDKIKHGNLSLYDTTLFGGSSFFGGVYYIPLDIFLFLAFLLSYFVPTEAAYCCTNLLRPALGALLIYYVFIRKNFKPKTAFIIAVIFFIGGMTEAYFVFPVFLGICFYAPLGMLLVDLCIEKKGLYYLFIPIYGLIIILYDFYIAYMLFAFICIYFVVVMHMKLNRFFLISKEFWLRFAEFMLLILLSVIISMFFLLPSALYVLFESSRGSQSAEYNIWYYALSNGKDISIRHYFTQWCNLFIPNTPFNLALIQPGDYIREHASLYLTSGGALYLGYFFLLRGKENHRLKFWIVAINLLFCIPLAAMIFTFNDWAYVRWFFIPYLINFYGMAIAMDKNDFKIGEKKFVKYIPSIFLVLGLSTLIYVLINKPDIYIHYDLDSVYYYPILIGSIVFIAAYIALIIAAGVIETCKKDSKIIYKIIPGVIFAEAIFACVIAFSTYGGGNQYGRNKELFEQKERFYKIGYTDTDGYRINLSTNLGKDTLNANILLRDVNHARVFQSFVNTPLRDYYYDIHGEKISSWNHTSLHGYNILSGAMFNVKYIAVDKDLGNYYQLSDHLYQYYGDDDYIDNNFDENANNPDPNDENYVGYYSATNMPQFIVYDTIFTKTTGHSSFENDVALLSYAYIKTPGDGITYDDLDPKKDEDKKKIEYLDMYNKIIDAGVSEINSKDMYFNLNNKYGIIGISANSYKYEGGHYYYDITTTNFNNLLTNYDCIYINPNSSDIVSQGRFNCYMSNKVDENTYYQPIHYNIIYMNRYRTDFTPYNLVLSGPENANSSIRLYGFNYEIYDDFIEAQNKYTDRYFKINGDQIKIKFTNNDTSKAKIVKTAYTYSDDWKVANNKYETCNVNGGFLGVIIPEGEEFIDITLNYEPRGFYTGCKISLVGCIIYLGITVPIVTVYITKRIKKRKEMN